VTATPKRRWYQFSLRGLWLAVTVSAVLFAILGRSLYLHRMAVFHDNEGMSCMTKECKSIDDLVAHSIEYAQHAELRQRYRYAAWRPWTIVDTKPPEIDRNKLDRLGMEVSGLPQHSAPAPNPPKP